MVVEDDLKIIERYQKEILLLDRADSMLAWDKRTYMPKGGAKHRAEQQAFLKGLVHEKFLSVELFEAVERLGKADLEGEAELIVNKIKKKILKKKSLSAKFVEEMGKACSSGYLLGRRRRRNRILVCSSLIWKRLLK